ncbi:MAG: iron-only hydrogenase system regulator [bacterium]|nr:iron-only hydrogenase system regulator [bacterium]
MDSRVAVIGIIVEDKEAVPQLNALLSEYGECIIGRMGIPYAKRGINIISVAIDAPQDDISALSGKIGALPGISVKTAFSSIGGQSRA